MLIALRYSSCNEIPKLTLAQTLNNNSAHHIDASFCSTFEVCLYAERFQFGETRLTDHKLTLAACAQGDKAALKSLMDAEGSQMMGVALRMLRRQDLAEDAVQDSFVAIWRKAKQFDSSRGSAKGWIYTILRNRCLTMLRKESWEIANDEITLEQHQDGQIVLDAYNRLDETSDLRQCLAGLDSKKRTAVLLAYVLGYSHGEISGRLQAPLGSVKAWVRRGLAQLRECLT